MKGKLIGVITNLVLIAVVVAVSLVGFFGGSAVTVSNENSNLFYSAENGEGVSLMFNVYEHTDNVYKILDALDEYDAKSTFFIGGITGFAPVAIISLSYSTKNALLLSKSSINTCLDKGIIFAARFFR